MDQSYLMGQVMIGWISIGTIIFVTIMFIVEEIKDYLRRKKNK